MSTRKGRQSRVSGVAGGGGGGKESLIKVAVVARVYFCETNVPLQIEKNVQATLKKGPTREKKFNKLYKFVQVFFL